MKKIFVFVFALLLFISLRAQLTNTKWKGTLPADDPITVVFNFKTDTLTVFNAQDNSELETILFTAKDTVLTLQKIYGQSECDAATTAKYKFEIKENTLSLKLIEDACNQRSAMINNSEWTKEEE